MLPYGESFGFLKPLGGGDPVNLDKEELIVGRRPSCNICLDFENLSGKHCNLRLINGIWHVKDLGSTNGTTVNGVKISTEQSLMPDDELGIAGHFFTIDYEPSGPATLLAGGAAFDEEVVETRKKHSLMELAGMDDGAKPKPKRATKPPAKIERLSTEEADFDDALPEDYKRPVPKVEGNDEDFLKLFEG